MTTSRDLGAVAGAETGRSFDSFYETSIDVVIVSHRATRRHRVCCSRVLTFRVIPSRLHSAPTCTRWP